MTTKQALAFYRRELKKLEIRKLITTDPVERAAIERKQEDTRGTIYYLREYCGSGIRTAAFETADGRLMGYAER